MSFARGRILGIVAVAAVGLASGGASGVGIASSSARRGAPAHERDLDSVATPPVSLAVPRVEAAVRIDGELDEPLWIDSAARTGGFRNGSNVVRPYSDARLAWRDGTLYVALYAADEDIVAPATTHDAPLWTGDSFHLVFRGANVERSIDVTPRGIVTDGERVGAGPFDPRWESHAKVAVDADGTVNDSSDEDEEWIVEMAIPLRELGATGVPGERIRLEISRCDRLRGADRSVQRSCASWGDSRSEIALR